MVEASQKTPSKDEAPLNDTGLVLQSIVASPPRRQGSAMNACGALDPAPGSQKEKCPLTTPTTLYMVHFGP